MAAIMRPPARPCRRSPDARWGWKLERPCL